MQLYTNKGGDIMRVTKWNYLVPIWLFIHYLMGTGNAIRIQLDDYDKSPMLSALYLSLGDYDYLRGKVIYGTKLNAHIPNIGKPFYIYWDVRIKV